MAKKKAKTAGKQRGKKGGNNSKNLIGHSFADKPENINKKGRPRKLVHEFNQQMKAEGYGPVKETQLIDTYETLLQLPEHKLQEVKNDKDQPLFLRRVAEWLSDKNKGMNMLEKLLDRAHGKAMMRAKVDNVVHEQPLFPDVPVKK